MDQQLRRLDRSRRRWRAIALALALGHVVVLVVFFLAQLDRTRAARMQAIAPERLYAVQITEAAQLLAAPTMAPQADSEPPSRRRGNAWTDRADRLERE